MRQFASLIAMLVGSSAWGQLPGGEERSTAPESLPPGGSEIFRGLLDLHGIQPWNPIPANRFEVAPPSPRPGELLIVVMGIPRSGHLEPILQSLLLQHHSLIAIRESYDLSDLLFQTQMQVTGRSARYHGTSKNLTPDSLPDGQRSNCPFLVIPFELGRIIQPNRDSMNPIARFPKIATYRPATLTFQSSPNNREEFPMRPLASLPTGSRDGGRTGMIIPPREFVGMGCEVMIGTPDNRRLMGTGFIRSTIVFADSNIFSNQLLALDGTDNLAFCQQYIKSLKDSGVQYCAFLDAGQPVEKFDDVKFQLSPITPPLPIPPPQLIDQLGTQIANQLTDQLDRTDALNNFWRDRPLWLGRLLSVLMGVLIALFAWALIRRAWARKHQPDLVPMPQHPFAKIKMSAGLVGQLQRDVIVGGDYGPVVRDYLRDLFLACGLPPNDQSRIPPPIRYDGKNENAPALAKDLFEIWTKAYISDQRINLAEWKKLEPKILKLWKAAHAGRWQFVDPNSIGKPG